MILLLAEKYVADDFNLGWKICSWWFLSWLKDTFISMAPPMFVHSSIAVLITRLLFWPNLFQLDGRRSIFLFFRITKNCSLQILCCFTAWEFTFQTPVFSFRFTGFLDFLDLSVSAQILLQIIDFVLLSTGTGERTGVGKSQNFVLSKQVLRISSKFSRITDFSKSSGAKTTALFSPQGCLQSLCLFWSETHFSITEWSEFTEPQSDRGGCQRHSVTHGVIWVTGWDSGEASSSNARSAASIFARSLPLWGGNYKDVILL